MIAGLLADDVQPQRLPPALREANRNHLSNGALLLLGEAAGVIPPAPTGDPRRRAGPVEIPSGGARLDLRVAANVRMGDDPESLPLTLRAQAEPHLARSPLDPDLLVAAFQEGRFTNGGAADAGYAISRNGGLSWSRTLVPGLKIGSGGIYHRVTDPVAGMDHRGNIYLNLLAAVTASFSEGALVVSRSTNGGLSFSAPVEIYRPTAGAGFPDKNWMAINTFTNSSTALRILVTYSRFFGTTVQIMALHSDDAGLSWSAPMPVTPANSVCQGSQPVFLPDGRVAVVYWNFIANDENRADDRIEVRLSGDGGLTYGGAVTVAQAPVHDDPQARDGWFLPSAATDRTNGHLFVTWQGLQNGSPRVLFSKSSDHGVTWTPPIAVSDNPTNVSVFNPNLAVSPDGRHLAIVFYDKRDGSDFLVDLFLAQSFDGGATWGPNLRLTPLSSDLRNAPRTDTGYMLGDYHGIAGSAGFDVPVVAAYVDARGTNADPYSVRIGAAPRLTFASWRAARFSSADIRDPGRGGLSADPDGDGVPNLAEYALAQDPCAPGSTPLSIAVSSFDGSADLAVSSLRNREATDLRFIWESSETLDDWSSAAPAGEATISHTDTPLETITATFRPSRPALFRIRVEAVAP